MPRQSWISIGWPLRAALALTLTAVSPLAAPGQDARPAAPVLHEQDKDGLPGASVGPSRGEIEALIRAIGRDPVSEELVDRIESVFRPRWASTREFGDVKTRAVDKAFVAKLDQVSEELTKKPADTRSILFRSLNHTTEAPLDEIRAAMTSDLDREGGTWKTIKGRVLGDEVGGKPIAGAVVSCISGSQARTDAKGNFTLKVRAPTTMMVINIEAPGRALTQTYSKWDDMEEVQSEVFRLPAAAPFGGTVVDDKGKPIAGAELALWMATEAICRDGSAAKVGWANGNALTMKARTDAEGRYAFRGVPPELEGRQAASLFTIAHPKYLGRVKQYAQNEWLGPGWQITMEPGCALAGTVVDDDGKPVAGASVMPNYNSATGTAPATTTDAEGRFRIEGLPTMMLHLIVRPKEHLATNVQATPKQGEVVEVKVKVARGEFITGKVVGADGKPAAGAFVGWARPLAAERLMRNVGTVKTADDGTFRVGPLVKGRYRVTATTNSPQATAAVEAEAGDKEVVIEMKAPPAVDMPADAINN